MPGLTLDSINWETHRGKYKECKINISIASTITTNIKPGRHVYDVLLTKPNGNKLIAVEGTALVRPGISTGCF